MLKPAETTPLTALLLADILQEAELPPGVVNVVTGDGATGAALVAHAGVDKIAFTGSTEVGQADPGAVAGTGKRLTLELGGKAANIVFADAALDQAVEGIVNGIYFNQGHVCCAGSRLLVEESVAETVVEKLKRRIATLRVGDRWTRTPTSAPSTRPSSSARIVSSSPPGSTRGPALAARRARCPSGATGSRRRSSPTSRSRTASRARRSSGRCCPC